MIEQISSREVFGSLLQSGSVLVSVLTIALSCMLYGIYFFEGFSDALKAEAEPHVEFAGFNNTYRGMLPWSAPETPSIVMRNVASLLFRNKLWTAMDLHRYLQLRNYDTFDRILLTHKSLSR